MKRTMRIRKSAVMLTASSLALLSGCTMIPTYHRPAAPVAAQYPTSSATDQSGDAGSVAAADMGWREFFKDPVLQQLVEISLKNNRDLRVAMLDVEKARAAYRIQRADLLPTITANADETAANTPANLAYSGQRTISHEYTVTAGVSWELDLFGRIRSLSQEALETYFSDIENQRAVHITLVSEVATAYVTLRSDQAQLGLTQDTLVSQQHSYDLSKQSFDQGISSALDLAEAESTLRTAQSNLAQYRRAVALDLNALVLLLGQPIPAPLAPAVEQGTSFNDNIVPARVPAGLPSDLLQRRPDILEAEHALKAANADIGAARAAFFPTISLSGNAGAASADLGNLFKGGQGYWSFAPSISVPIFEGGALRASLDSSKIEKNIEVANYEKAIQSAFKDVANALAGESTYDQQIQAQRLLVDADQRSYDLSNQLYRAGESDYLTVLTSQRALYTAQQDLVTLRLSRVSNLITLYQALGGGWYEHTQKSSQEPGSAAAATPTAAK